MDISIHASNAVCMTAIIAVVTIVAIWFTVSFNFHIGSSDEDGNK